MEKNSSLSLQKSSKIDLNSKINLYFNRDRVSFLEYVYFVLVRLDKLLKILFLFFVGIYRTFGSQYLGGNCRFSPSCSEYAQQALHKHHFICAFQLIIKRILKCHPFGAYGYDPVPERKIHARTTK